MILMDTLYSRFFVVVAIMFVALGVYSYYDRGRTIECRTQAQAKGLPAADAVLLCKN